MAVVILFILLDKNARFYIVDHSGKVLYSLSVLVNLAEHFAKMKSALIKILINYQNLEVHLNRFFAVI